jgi:hypothetical protein
MDAEPVLSGCCWSQRRCHHRRFQLSDRCPSGLNGDVPRAGMCCRVVRGGRTHQSRQVPHARTVAADEEQRWTYRVGVRLPGRLALPNRIGQSNDLGKSILMRLVAESGPNCCLCACRDLLVGRAVGVKRRITDGNWAGSAWIAASPNRGESALEGSPASRWPPCRGGPHGPTGHREL